MLFGDDVLGFCQNGNDKHDGKHADYDKQGGLQCGGESVYPFIVDAVDADRQSRCAQYQRNDKQGNHHSRKFVFEIFCLF